VNEARSQHGVLFGLAAVVCWSFGAAFVYVGGPVLGTWRFVGVTTLVGGVLQLVFHRVRHGQIRSALALPGRLWLVTLFGFVLNVLVYPLALSAARGDAQQHAVNLINYLWPVLMVVCGLLWVPGTRFSWMTLVAVVCALGGTALANLEPLRVLLRGAGVSDAPWQIRPLVPYLLASIAAVTWAVYSSLMARWRDWARHYNTSAVGLVILGILAGLVSLAVEHPCSRLTLAAAAATLLCAITTQAGGYLFWESALSRANVKVLGLLGGLAPILSTIWLCLFQQHVPGVELVLAAVLVSAAALLGMRS
jgi:drug/metabolite transporter (DMT)-like permease